MPLPPATIQIYHSQYRPVSRMRTTAMTIQRPAPFTYVDHMSVSQFGLHGQTNRIMYSTGSWPLEIQEAKYELAFRPQENISLGHENLYSSRWISYRKQTPNAYTDTLISQQLFNTRKTYADEPFRLYILRLNLAFRGSHMENNTQKWAKLEAYNALVGMSRNQTWMASHKRVC